MIEKEQPNLWRMREAALSDCEKLALVGAATFLETFAGILEGEAIVAHCRREHSVAAYERQLLGRAVAWLAEADAGAAPLGYALLGDTDLPGSQAGDLELKRIYVLSRFHGSGVGAELMQLAIDRASRHGAKRLLLGVYAGNQRARAFYEKNGFSKIADRRFPVGDRDYDDTVFARGLS